MKNKLGKIVIDLRSLGSREVEDETELYLDISSILDEETKSLIKENTENNFKDIYVIIPRIYFKSGDSIIADISSYTYALTNHTPTSSFMRIPFMTEMGVIAFVSIEILKSLKLAIELIME